MFFIFILSKSRDGLCADKVYRNLLVRSAASHEIASDLVLFGRFVSVKLGRSLEGPRPRPLSQIRNLCLVTERALKYSSAYVGNRKVV